VLFQVLFRVALALLRFMEPALLSAHGVAAVYDMLRSPALEDDLVENMYGFWLQGFSTDILIQLRDQHLVFVTSQEPWISHMISPICLSKSRFRPFACQNQDQIESVGLRWNNHD
jgi:hypothetical protein